MSSSKVERNDHCIIKYTLTAEMLNFEWHLSVCLSLYLSAVYITRLPVPFLQSRNSAKSANLEALIPHLWHARSLLTGGAFFMSKSYVKVTWNENVKIPFCTYSREKCINLSQIHTITCLDYRLCPVNLLWVTLVHPWIGYRPILQNFS